MNTLISRDIIKMVNVAMATSLLNGHLRSEGTSIPTPSHPEPASHNRSSSIDQCSWKGGKGSPGRCSREESQHRRNVVSSGNHKSLQCKGLKGGMGWSHPSGRKSSARMAVSILRQLGELLDKPAGIVPGKYVWKLYLLTSSLRTLNSIIIMFMINILINTYSHNLNH